MFTILERIDAIWNENVRRKIELNEVIYADYIGKPIQEFIDHVAKDGYTDVHILKEDGKYKGEVITLVCRYDRINVCVRNGNLEMIEGIY
jgi:hypothetical protein